MNHTLPPPTSPATPTTPPLRPTPSDATRRNLVRRVDPLEHRSILQEIRNDHKPHPTSSHENMLHMRHLAVPPGRCHVGQLYVPIVLRVRHIPPENLPVLQLYCYHMPLCFMEQLHRYTDAFERRSGRHLFGCLLPNAISGRSSSVPFCALQSFVWMKI